MPDRWDRKTDYNCGSCMYCVPKSQDEGRCRRHAPALQGYPVVYLRDDWCGDHKLGTNPVASSKAGYSIPYQQSPETNVTRGES